jgi:hypothetical protein
MPEAQEQEVRKRPPNRREIETITFTFAGITHHGSVGVYPDDGEPAEIWLEAGKVGSDVQQAARSTAISSSLAIQHGCPLKTIKGALPKLHNNKAADALGTFLALY